MRIFSFKLNKAFTISIGILMLGLILFISNFIVYDGESVLKDDKMIDNNEKDYEKEKFDEEMEEIEGIEFKTAEETGHEVMEIFPRDDYDDWEIEHQKEFFIEYRMQRERIRAREIEELNKLMDKEDISQEVKEKAENTLLEVLSAIEKEMVIENLIKAHGFEDAIFFYGEESVTVVVKAESLSETEVYQITELISDKTDLDMNDIKVVEKGH